jgi:formylglycine-generating enzyme required for sulfatase activity
VYVPRPPPQGFLLGIGKPSLGSPVTRATLSKPFCFDQTEVTVEQYRHCVDRGACSLPELKDPNSNYAFGTLRDRHPVNLVSWDQALVYCESLDKTLPTEAEWKWAAGHGDGRRYPWGNEDPTCQNGLADFTPGGAPKKDPAGDVGCHGGGTSEVGSHPGGNSRWPAGDLFDLGGNVWEWTRDCYLPLPPGTVVDPSPQVHPWLKDQCYTRALVGGGWNRSHEALKIRFRAGSRHTYRVPGLGFRCLREIG